MKPTKTTKRYADAFFLGEIDRRRLLRRSLGAGAAAVALGTLGRGRLTVAQDAVDPATLEGEVAFWHGLGDQGSLVAEFIEPAWAEAYPNVTLDTLSVPFDQLQNKYNTEASAGGGPHVLLGPSDWIGSYVEAEIIQPLDELAGADFAAGYNPTAILGMSFDGKLYAVPQNINGVALVYNKALMPEPPATSDALIAMAGTIGATAGTYGIGVFPQFYNNAGYLYGFGGTTLTPEDTSGFDSPEAVEWLTFLQTLIASPGVFLGQDQNSVESLFNEGKLGAMINGPWFTANATSNIGAENFGVATLPKIAAKGGADPKPFVGIQGLYINSNFDEEESIVALEFAKWFSTAGTQVFVEQAGQLPASVDVPLPDSNPNAATWLAQYELGTPLPSTPKMSQVWTPADDMLAKVMRGESTPEEAASSAAETINRAG
jgi:arabinogalactan oligomer/maltooligosaccharide transport system substrate-binding protein